MDIVKRNRNAELKDEEIAKLMVENRTLRSALEYNAVFNDMPELLDMLEGEEEDIGDE